VEILSRETVWFAVPAILPSLAALVGAALFGCAREPGLAISKRTIQMARRAAQGIVLIGGRFDACLLASYHCADEAGVTKRILVVEDQDDNLQILRDLLTSAGFDILEAKDGEAGVRTAVAERPDLILMDIQLPVLDGYAATRRIKADPALRAIPIIVVTSYALSGDEDKAREAGCDDYVPKPFSPRQLLAKIRRFLPVN
jgi:two-component system, cell cycle response regulator DivK